MARGGGDHSREAIILNISIKGGGGNYAREAINRGTAIIRRNAVHVSPFRFEESM